jgi:hypothetical protein
MNGINLVEYLLLYMLLELTFKYMRWGIIGKSIC